MCFHRDHACDLQLQWDGVSRRHARLEGTKPDGSGIPTKWYAGHHSGNNIKIQRFIFLPLSAVCDSCPRDSVPADEGGDGKNGTFVNGVRVRRQALKEGDTIGIGRGRDLQEGDRISEKNLQVTASK